MLSASKTSSTGRTFEELRNLRPGHFTGAAVLPDEVSLLNLFGGSALDVLEQIAQGRKYSDLKSLVEAEPVNFDLRRTGGGRSVSGRRPEQSDFGAAVIEYCLMFADSRELLKQIDVAPPQTTRSLMRAARSLQQLCRKLHELEPLFDNAPLRYAAPAYRIPDYTTSNFASTARELLNMPGESNPLLVDAATALAETNTLCWLNLNRARFVLSVAHQDIRAGYDLPKEQAIDANEIDALAALEQSSHVSEYRPGGGVWDGLYATDVPMHILKLQTTFPEVNGVVNDVLKLRALPAEHSHSESLKRHLAPRLRQLIGDADILLNADPALLAAADLSALASLKRVFHWMVPDSFASPDWAKWQQPHSELMPLLGELRRFTERLDEQV